MRRTWGIAVLRRNWTSLRPIIAIVIGLAVFSLATVDYATSPTEHKGLHVGPLFFTVPGMKSPVAAGHKPVAGHPPTTNGGTTPASGLKYPLLGLLDRQGAPSASFYTVLNGYVVNVSWASLQTSAGGPITSNNAIEIGWIPLGFHLPLAAASRAPCKVRSQCCSVERSSDEFGCCCNHVHSPKEPIILLRHIVQGPTPIEKREIATALMTSIGDHRGKARADFRRNRKGREEVKND